MQSIELRGRREAMRLVKGLFPFIEYAARDENQVLRHGHGRQIEHRRMSSSVADVVLNDELMRISDCLHGRIVHMVVTRPESAAKVGILFALADITGPEVLRDWAPLWDALRRGDDRGAAGELLNANWDRYYGSTPEKRRKILDLVLQIMPGDATAKRQATVQ